MTDLLTLNPLIAVYIPVVIGLIAVAKQTGLPTRFAPLAALVLGIALTALTGTSWQADILQGIITGLSAAGLYSGSLTVFNPTVSETTAPVAPTAPPAL